VCFLLRCVHWLTSMLLSPWTLVHLLLLLMHTHTRRGAPPARSLNYLPQELVSYDLTKEALIERGWEEGPVLYSLGALSAGFWVGALLPRAYLAPIYLQPTALCPNLWSKTLIDLLQRYSLFGRFHHSCPDARRSQLGDYSSHSNCMVLWHAHQLCDGCCMAQQASYLGNPFDVIKTRVYNNPLDASGRPLYTGPISCTKYIFKNEVGVIACGSQCTCVTARHERTKYNR